MSPKFAYLCEESPRLEELIGSGKLTVECEAFVLDHRASADAGGGYRSVGELAPAEREQQRLRASKNSAAGGGYRPVGELTPAERAQQRLLVIENTTAKGDHRSNGDFDSDDSEDCDARELQRAEDRRSGVLGRGARPQSRGQISPEAYSAQSLKLSYKKQRDRLVQGKRQMSFVFASSSSFAPKDGRRLMV